MEYFLVLYALNAFYYTKNFFILLFFRLFNNETTPTHIMAIYPITALLNIHHEDRYHLLHACKRYDRVVKEK